MRDRAMLYWTFRKVALLLFSLTVIVTLSACNKSEVVEESDPFAVPYTNGPTSPPFVGMPDGPPLN